MITRIIFTLLYIGAIHTSFQFRSIDSGKISIESHVNPLIRLINVIFITFFLLSHMVKFYMSPAFHCIIQRVVLFTFVCLYLNFGVNRFSTNCEHRLTQK